MRTERRVEASDANRVRGELLELAASWRHVLAHDTDHARPIISMLLKGRVAFTPTSITKQWTLCGEGTLIELFERLLPSGWRPQCLAVGTTSSPG